MGGKENGERKTYLALNKVADASLGHDWDGHGGHDLFDHFWIGHAGYATLGADVCWDALVYVRLCAKEGRVEEGWLTSNAMTATAPASSAMRA